MGKNIFSAIIILCILFGFSAYTQVPSASKHTAKNKKLYKGSEKNLAVFMNMFSLLEPQQAAIGAGVDYKIAKRWDLSAEVNYLFEGFWQGGDDYKTKGSRLIFTVKRFSRTGIFFYGLDARIKYFSFVDKRNFINPSTADTLFNFKHNASNTLLGIAPIVGVRLPISKNKRWAFELNTGVGTKHRDVKRKGIPAGYEYYRNNFISKEYNFTSNQDISSDDNVYFPTTIRVMYFF